MTTKWKASPYNSSAQAAHVERRAHRVEQLQAALYNISANHESPELRVPFTQAYLYV